jgi:hypothetical protein
MPADSLITGAIDDCCCDVAVAHEVNEQILPVLHSLFETPFFKYYKVRVRGMFNAWFK